MDEPQTKRARADDGHHQQYGHVDGGDHSSDAAAAAAIAAAAAAAAAGAEVAASQAMAAITDPTAQGDAAAQAAAEAQAAAQLAQLNAEAAQQAAQVSQQQIDLLAQAHTLALDPATLAAMQALPVSGGLPAQALQLDPNLAATLVAQGLQIPGFTTVVDQNGNMQLMGTEGLQLGHGAEMYMTQGHEDYADLQRQQIEGLRKADYQALAGAKRSGQLATINFTLDLPDELADVELTERNGIIECPATADVQMLKRLFQYQAYNKLLPALQTLVTDQNEEMVDAKEDGTPMPLAHYNVGDGSHIILRIHVPEELDNIPMVDEALASAAYTSATAGARTPSRKTRWTTEQIEALIEGVEKYGLSAWRTIVMDPRLNSKNNMQCKDKFRNLCLTIIQGRPERGLTLPWQLKDRVRALIEQENIKVGFLGGNSYSSGGGRHHHHHHHHHGAAHQQQMQAAGQPMDAAAAAALFSATGLAAQPGASAAGSAAASPSVSAAANGQAAQQQLMAQHLAAFGGYAAMAGHGDGSVA